MNRPDHPPFETERMILPRWRDDGLDFAPERAVWHIDILPPDGAIEVLA